MLHTEIKKKLTGMKEHICENFFTQNGYTAEKVLKMS